MDYICEFCFISYEILKKLSKEYKLEIEYILCQVHPENPPMGMPMKEHVKNHTEWTEQLNKIIKNYGKSFADKEIFANTEKSLMLGEYALSNNKFYQITDDIWHEYMEKGMNISDERLLFEIAMKNGISPKECKNIFKDEKIQKLLILNELSSESYDRTDSIPKFVINDEYLMIGLQSEETWKKLFRKIEDELSKN